MMEPIRVLCVFSTLDRGGAESMCMNLYRAIDRTKVQFDFVKHTTGKGSFEDEILSLGGRIYVAPRYRVYNHLVYTRWWKNHLKNHPEHRIIHGHFFTFSAVYFKIAKQMKRITVAHSHSSATTRPIVKLYTNRIEKYSDYCFACSKNAGDWLFPHKEYKILKNAIDSAKYIPDEVTRAEVREEFGIRQEQKVVGVIGSFSPVKNPMGVLDIFRIVHEEVPDSVLLWCGDGALRSDIEAKIKELKLQDSVILAGVRSDIPRMLQAMDVYIMPSLSEGLPVAGIESQAAGIPCLFSDTVSREVAITDCCEFFPLNYWEEWKNRIIVAFTSNRKDTSCDIAAAGYDINTTANWLQEFYLHI